MFRKCGSLDSWKDLSEMDCQTGYMMIVGALVFILGVVTGAIGLFATISYLAIRSKRRFESKIDAIVTALPREDIEA